MSRRSFLAACASVSTLACCTAFLPSALGAERSLYLYCETPKFFPATYNDHADVDWWFAEDGVLDDDVFCIRLTSDLVLWTGVCWLHDEGDAGWFGPGVDLSGVSRVEFRARRESGGSGSRIKVEAIDGAELQWVSLGASWGEYSIPITHPADRVRNLFSVVLDPSLSPQTVYLDDIRFVYDRPVAPVPAAVTGSIFDRSARGGTQGACRLLAAGLGGLPGELLQPRREARPGKRPARLPADLPG